MAQWKKFIPKLRKNLHITLLPHYIVNSNQPNKTNLCIHENDCLNQNICTCQTFVKIVLKTVNT